MFIKELYKAPDGRLLSLSAHPQFGPLAQGWVVEYIEGQWVKGILGSLLFVDEYDEPPTHEQLDLETWECEVCGPSDQAQMLDPCRVQLADELAKFWTTATGLVVTDIDGEIPEVFWTQHIVSWALLVEKVRLVRRLC